MSKRFGAVQALSDVDFEVHAGEVVALVGDNGAGKSTLVKTIAGIHPADEGEITFDGQRGAHLGRRTDAADLGIATVYQDLALCDNLDVVANLFLGREETAAGPARSRASSTRSPMEQQTRRAARDARGARSLDVRSEVGTLSGGQRQRWRSPARCSASRSW